MRITSLRDEFPVGVWCIDTEYVAPRGEHVIPVCLVARELFTGRCIREFFEPGQQYVNPLPVDQKALFVSFSACAEWSAFRSLGWELPKWILDLAIEFRNETANKTPPRGIPVWKLSLLEAMAFYKLDHMAGATKKSMRDRILRGHPFSAQEREEILLYCEEDVLALEMLLPTMQRGIELPYAIFRGVFTRAASAIEWNGLPVDTENYRRLLSCREKVKLKLVEGYESAHGPCPYSRDRKGAVHFRKTKLSEFLETWGFCRSGNSRQQES